MSETSEEEVDFGFDDDIVMGHIIEDEVNRNTQRKMTK